MNTHHHVAQDHRPAIISPYRHGLRYVPLSELMMFHDLYEITVEHRSPKQSLDSGLRCAMLQALSSGHGYQQGRLPAAAELYRS
jgi:hypothetical protein